MLDGRQDLMAKAVDMVVHIGAVMDDVDNPVCLFEADVLLRNLFWLCLELLLKLI